jgi:transposase-like protein
LLDGGRVVSLAEEFSISVHTLYKSRRQAPIVAGGETGIKSGDVDPSADARRRILELESELALVKAASALFAEAGGGASVQNHPSKLLSSLTRNQFHHFWREYRRQPGWSQLGSSSRRILTFLLRDL